MLGLILSNVGLATAVKASTRGDGGMTLFMSSTLSVRNALMAVGSTRDERTEGRGKGGAGEEREKELAGIAGASRGNDELGGAHEAS